jgi:hypothetical protein
VKKNSKKTKEKNILEQKSRDILKDRKNLEFFVTVKLKKRKNFFVKMEGN